MGGVDEFPDGEGNTCQCVKKKSCTQPVPQLGSPVLLWRQNQIKRLAESVRQGCGLGRDWGPFIY